MYDLVISSVKLIFLLFTRKCEALHVETNNLTQFAPGSDK